MTGTITVSGPGAPVVSTGAGTATSDTEATLAGTVNPNGLPTEYFFKYGTTTSYGHTTGKKSAGQGTSAVPASAEATELSPGTTYHFQLVAENSSGTTPGSDHTFTTPGPPLVTTGTATGIAVTEATLQGSVNPEGHETHYFFKYGTTTAYGQTTSLQLAGSDHSQHAVSATLTGLSPETTYHFQLVAENSSGKVSGADRTFATTATPPPLATTEQATGIGETEATLQGSVNAEGHETTYFFNYGTTTSYGQKTTEKSAGGGIVSVPVSATLTGLSPETTYHFQLVAENSSGKVSGVDRTFTTSSPPTTTTPVVTPPPPVGETPPLSSAVTVGVGRHGAPVRVSVQILASGAGGRLQVDLLERGGRPKHAIAGRILRREVPSGKVSVSVPLNARAKRSLRRRHRLPLEVKIVFTPPSGASRVVTRSVILRS